MYVKYVMYSLLGWHDRCTSISKGMCLWFYIAHATLIEYFLGDYSMYMNMNAWLRYEHERIWYDEVCICLVSKCGIWKISSCMKIYTHVNECIIKYVW